MPNAIQQIRCFLAILFIGLWIGKALGSDAEVSETQKRMMAFGNTSTEEIYPARHNILIGEVHLRNIAGKPLTDRNNIVVFIDQIKTEIPKVPHRAIISQKGRQFSPRVLPIVKGTTIEFPNDDTIFHNIFSLSKTESFDLDIYSPGQTRTVTFDQTGWVKVYCNIHPDMIAHILVLENPYFALTDESGAFVIPIYPMGSIP